jgi:hypothetical protein
MRASCQISFKNSVILVYPNATLKGKKNLRKNKSDQSPKNEPVNFWTGRTYTLTIVNGAEGEKNRESI